MNMPPHPDLIVQVSETGYLNATSFSTEYGYDKLYVSDMLYSGTQGPQQLFTPAGTFVNFSSDHYIEEEGWELCWTEDNPVPKHNQLEIVGLSRNYLVGSIQAEHTRASLRSIILSSNFLSCDANLQGDSDDHSLGTGIFKEPTSDTLRAFGTILAQAYPNVQPFGLATEYHNVVLAFAGNSQLSTEASFLPPHEPDELRHADLIQQGSRGLFSGFTDFKQLVYLTVPALAILHMIVVKRVIGGSAVPEYLRLSVLWGIVTGNQGSDAHKHFGLETYIFARSVQPGFLLLFLGLCLILLFVLSPSTYSIVGGCVDPAVMITIADVEAQTAFQWLWVLVANAVFCTASFNIELLIRDDPFPRALCVYQCMHRLAKPPSSMIASIATWQAKVEIWGAHSTEAVWRRLLFYLLHFPLVLVGSLPAVAYVLVQNSPSHGFVYDLMGNPLVLMVLQTCFSTLVAPRTAKWLASVRHGFRTGTHSISLTLSFYKTQVLTLLVRRFQYLANTLLL